ncbi:MAG: site-2 protease family protein [Verrucomicrobiales bacterium]
MLPTDRGGFRLFRAWGINVYLHWSWLVVAAFEIYYRKGYYSSVMWNALEYGALFGIVLLHEFGHALACRQVGGQANEIILWPLGGVAYVAPPPRPGAVLWSLAAGPLVNVLLVPVFLAVLFASSYFGLAQSMPDAAGLLETVTVINLVLLIFNMLPVYPLDGGQILRALLWFPLGRARSLLVATTIGLVGVVGFAAYAWWRQSIWMGIVTIFVAMNCWRSFQQARGLMRLAAAPRREEFACPACKVAPPRGVSWRCEKCHQVADPFENLGLCPHCGAAEESIPCLHCGTRSPPEQWQALPGIHSQ